VGFSYLCFRVLGGTFDVGYRVCPTLLVNQNLKTSWDGRTKQIMKKVIFLSFIFALTSCAKDSKQIDVIKNKLSQLNVTNDELESFQFNVTELPDKDIYKMIQKKYQKNVDDAKALGDTDYEFKQLKKVSHYVDLQGKATGKTFYKVHAYRVADADTLDNNLFYLDDNNSIIDYK